MACAAGCATACAMGCEGVPDKAAAAEEPLSATLDITEPDDAE